MFYDACLVLGEEISQLETLEGQWRAALDKHKLRKRHVKQLEEDLQVKYYATLPCDAVWQKCIASVCIVYCIGYGEDPIITEV